MGVTGAPALVGRSSAEIQRKAARGDLAAARARLAACGADAELVALAGDCLAAEREDRPRDAVYGPSRIDLPTRRTKQIDLWMAPIGNLIRTTDRPDRTTR